MNARNGACAPVTLAAWHVRNDKSHSAVNGGRRRVNHWSLGIEVVNAQDAAGTDRFSDWQVEVTARIVRYCWAKYPNLRHVVAHARLDPARRTDPGERFPWDRFKNLVLAPPAPAVPFAELTALAVNAADIPPAAADADLCGFGDEDAPDAAGR